MNVTNFVAQKAAKKMCKWKFIYPEQEDEYTYSIQVIFEKVIGYFVLLFLSVFNHLFWQTVIFLIFFSNLRKYTGGYHAGSFFECMGLSVIGETQMLMRLQNARHIVTAEINRY